MITEPDWNRIRIAVESVIALSSYEHIAQQIAAKDIPGLTKCALLGSATSRIAIEYAARVNAIRNGHTRRFRGETVHILNGTPTSGETRRVMQAIKRQLPPGVTLH